MKKMKIKSEDCSSDQAPAIRVRYDENSDGNLSCEDWGAQVHGDVGWNLQQHVPNGGNVPMMVNNNEIASGSVVGDGTMNYGVPMQLE